MFSTLFNRKQLQLTAYLLLLGFLFQPIMVYWASPWFDTNQTTGQTEIICTLKGERLQNIPADSPLAELFAQINNNDDYCPVLQLVDMANTALTFSLPDYIATTSYMIGLLEQTAHHQHHSLHYSAYSSRAPPVLS
jgi:hypothetical protein